MSKSCIFDDLNELDKPLKMRFDCYFQRVGCPCDGCVPDSDNICLMW